MQTKTEAELAKYSQSLQERIDALRDEADALEYRQQRIDATLRERTGCDCLTLGVICKGHGFTESVRRD